MLKLKEENYKVISFVLGIVGILLLLTLIFLIFSNSNTINNNSSNLNNQNNLNPIVIIETNNGNIKIELFPDKSPVTVKNFLNYVNSDFYSNTVFHRVIDGFMIQGGGFTSNGTKKITNNPIKIESNNGLNNEIGTIAMARTNDPNSATSQFFINVNNNTFLDYKNNQNPGYTVFGKVIEGMDVVNLIKNVKTTTKFSSYQNWPIEDIIILKVYLEK